LPDQLFTTGRTWCSKLPGKTLQLRPEYAGGADVATKTAGVTLMRGDLRLVADSLDISRRTYSKIQLGLFWAFGHNILGIPLAAFGMLKRAPQWRSVA